MQKVSILAVALFAFARLAVAEDSSDKLLVAKVSFYEGKDFLMDCQQVFSQDRESSIETPATMPKVDALASECQVKGKIGAKHDGKFPVDVTFSHTIPKKVSSDHTEYQIAATRAVANVAAGQPTKVRIGQENEKNQIWAELVIEDIKPAPPGAKVYSHPFPAVQR